MLLCRKKQWTIYLDDVDPEDETTTEDGHRIFGEIANQVGVTNPGPSITTAVKVVKAIAELNYEIRS